MEGLPTSAPSQGADWQYTCLEGLPSAPLGRGDTVTEATLFLSIEMCPLGWQSFAPWNPFAKNEAKMIQKELQVRAVLPVSCK